MSWDFQSLLKLSSPEEIESFLHECVENLIKKQKTNYFTPDKSASGEVLLSDEEHEHLQKQIQGFYRQCVINDNIIVPNEMPNNIKSLISNCFRIRQKDIFRFVAKDSIIQTDAKLVENIDWKLKWIMGSSKLATVREPLLQLYLHCVEKGQNNEEKTSTLSFEANLELVNVLIDELTKVKTQLENQ